LQLPCKPFFFRSHDKSSSERLRTGFIMRGV